MNQYNDYELLYLIYECDEEALGILFNKYEPFIKKKIFDFKINRTMYDDFFQEGLLSLDLAIRKYNPFYDKSFFKFFEMILTRRIMTLLHKNRDAFYGEVAINDEELYCEEVGKFAYADLTLSESRNDSVVLRDQTISLAMLTDFEKEVFELTYSKGMKPKEIASVANIDIRKVYNSIYRIKIKVTSRLANDKMN